MTVRKTNAQKLRLIFDTKFLKRFYSLQAKEWSAALEKTTHTD